MKHALTLASVFCFLLSCRTSSGTFAPPRALSGHSTAFPIQGYWGGTSGRKMQIGVFHLTATHTDRRKIRSRTAGVGPRNVFFGRNRAVRTLYSQLLDFEAVGFDGVPVRVVATDEVNTEVINRINIPTGAGGSVRWADNTRQRIEFAGTVAYPTDSTTAKWQFAIGSNWQTGMPPEEALEQGILTNERELILISPAMRTEVVNPDTGESVQLPGLVGRMQIGYNFYEEDTLIGHLNSLDGKLWLEDSLSGQRKTLVCAVAVALLKRWSTNELAR